MGRAFYSQSFLPTPIIHTEPEAAPVCERWTSWDHFDPDSEEFFQDAEYEAFLDPAQSVHDQAAEINAGALASSPTGMSEESELDQHWEGTVDANNSPMADGPDTLEMLISNLRNRSRQSNDADLDTYGSGWPPMQRPFNARDITESEAFQNLVDNSPVQTTPAFFPSPSIRSASPLRSPTPQRMVPITPITITRTRTRVEHRDTDPAPTIERSPSPVSPGAPATPPPMRYRLQPPRSIGNMTLATPSPPPSVTPRFYSWQQHPLPAAPNSPLTGREREREGPLPNPLARMSFVRIDAGPGRARITNPVM